MDRTPSYFERLIGNPRRRWLVLGAAVLLWLVPFAGAALADDPAALFGMGRWRGLLVAPSMILFILLVAPYVDRYERRVYAALRPVVLLGDADYAHLIRAATAVPVRNEVLAVGVGVVFGYSRVGLLDDAFSSWLSVYLIVSTTLMFGLLAWVIYLSLANTRVTGAILRQPLCVDPCEISAFEAIGRYGLVLAVVFIGGMSLSLLFSALDPGVFGQVSFWLIYVPIALVPIGIFFFAMQPTHRVLAGAKAQELKRVRDTLHRAGERLVERLAQGQEPGTATAEVTALAALEQRLHAARTWPYNTTMLRTLFVSVLVPSATLAARTVIGRFLGV